MVSEEATITEHLEELRWRIIVGGAAILVCAALAFALSGQILHLLLLPANGMQLKAFNLMDGVMLRWRIALYSGIILAFPVWGFELYRFTSPGLHEHERRLLMPALVGAFILFLLGAGFGYSMLWEMIGALIGMFPHQVDYLPSANDYLSFVLFFLLVCGLAFQLPLGLLLLVQLRLLSSTSLRRRRRIAYFALFAVAEIITPVSDPIIAPLTVAAPLVILYEVAILAARRVERRRARASRSAMIAAG